VSCQGVQPGIRCSRYRGRPAYVLLTIEDYRRLAGGNMSLAEALAQSNVADFEFKPPRVGGFIKPANLG
jgi:hypothetical protein